MKTIVIFGGGFIGSILVTRLKEDGMGVTVLSTRIESAGDVKRALSSVKDPFVVINAIGKRGTPNVDWCEDNKEETYASNVTVPLFIAEAAWSHPRVLPMMHISSGCIFDGNDRIWRDIDEPNFVGSYYSYTKREAERELIKLQDMRDGNIRGKLDIHRIRMPFVKYPDDRNLLTKLIRYEKVVDTANSITSVDDYVTFISNRISDWIVDEENGAGLMTDPNFGWRTIIHCVNEEPITHRRILEIFQEEDSTHNYLNKEFVTTDGLRALTKAPRTNCILKRSEKFQSRPTEVAIRDAIRSYIPLITKKI